MREVYLSDKPNSLRQNAFLELEIYSVYPEDEPSREQALQLVNDEYQRWLQCGGVDYQPSSLVQGILTSIQKSAGRRATAGLVALVMCLLDNAKKPMTLELASEIVCELNNTEGKHAQFFWKEGTWSLREIRSIGDQAKIKQAFREYRSVSHLLAAGLVASHYLDLMEPFQRTPEADACYFSTALYFQHRLRKVGNFKKWNLWEVRISPPYDPKDFPPLEPPVELVHYTMVPWLDAQKGEL